MSLLSLFNELARTPELCNDYRVPHFPSPQIVGHVDMYPIDGGVEVKVDLPGMEKEEISLSVSGHTLGISGSRSTHTEQSRDKWHYAERRSGSFKRNLRLPFPAVTENVQATFNNGVLTVTVREPETPDPGRITIN